MRIESYAYYDDERLSKEKAEQFLGSDEMVTAEENE